LKRLPIVELLPVFSGSRHISKFAVICKYRRAVGRININPQIARLLKLDISVRCTDAHQLSRPQGVTVKMDGTLCNSKIDVELAILHEAHI